MSQNATHSPAPVRRTTGTLIVAGMFLVALLAAGASWWFRYEATHRTDQFWGPAAAALIRDAPQVELFTLRPADAAADQSGQLGGLAWQIADHRDVTTAHGMIHLRNALLEDRSFVWPALGTMPDAEWRWGLQFNDPRQASAFTVWLSSDCSLACRAIRDPASRTVPGPGTSADGADHSAGVISCAPIAAGLRSFIAELTATPPAAE